MAKDSTVRTGANKPGLLTLTIKDKSALYLAYMPFVNNGGLFIPTNSNYRVGDEVFNGNVRAITDKQERDKVNDLTMRKYWYLAPMLRMGQFLMSMGMVRDNTAAFEVILADE